MNRPEPTSSPVVVYSQGLVHCSVCVPKRWPRAEVVAEVNNAFPTGIDSHWRIADDPTFKGGEPNPCPCSDDTENRLHYLMEC